jgi:hypothetical protein
MNISKSLVLSIPTLFRPLDHLLISFLRNLSPADWQKQTSARAWSVKDVVSHLLDGNLRTLSIQRDRHFGDKPPEDSTYKGMVQWLNMMNAEWIKATRRLSPEVLIMLHDSTGPMVSSYYESLEPYEEAIFSVQWAGENTSNNWMHLAREYTEKWHHQQQIREAFENRELLAPLYFIPYIDTSLLGLPFHFQKIDSPETTTVQIHITGEIDSYWTLRQSGSRWELSKEETASPDAYVGLTPDHAWKLFSRNIRAADVLPACEIHGDQDLAKHALNLVAVMA